MFCKEGKSLFYMGFTLLSTYIVLSLIAPAQNTFRAEKIEKI